MTADIASLVTKLREAWDNEIEAEALARRVAAEGPAGIEALVVVLRDSSGDYPKLAVGILNALRDSVNPYAKELLSKLIEEDVLSDEDSAYLLSILGTVERRDREHGRRLLLRLKQTRDPASQAEILNEIVKLRVLDAKEVLAEMSQRMGARGIDYDLRPEEAVQNDRVRFALWALEGCHDELERAAFGPDSHPYRRVAALEVLCLSRGEGSNDVLRRAVRDPDYNFRGVAFGLIGELGLVDLSDLIEVGLKDSNAWVVQQAAYGLRDLASNSEFSMDLDRVRRLHRALLDSLDARKKSSDRTDQQIIVPVLQKVSLVVGGLLS
jgi:hypothetical protein